MTSLDLAKSLNFLYRRLLPSRRFLRTLHYDDTVHFLFRVVGYSFLLLVFSFQKKENKEIVVGKRETRELTSNLLDML